VFGLDVFIVATAAPITVAKPLATVRYIFSEQPIEREDVIETLKVKPKLLKRKSIALRVIDKINHFVNTFVSGLVA